MTKPDYQLIETLLSPTPVLITADIFLDREFWGWVSNFKPVPSRLLSLFARSDDIKVPLKFHGELFCESCRHWKPQEMSKTWIINVINNLVPKKKGGSPRKNLIPVLCAECKVIADKREADEQAARWAEQDRQRDEARGITDADREAWHDAMLHKPVPKDYRWSQTKDNLDNYSEVCGDDEIKRRIRAMPYKEFLYTTYWKLVAYRVKQQAGGRCSICNRHDTLSVHHRSYDNHGAEHTWHGMKDLLAVCDPCHKRHHFNGKPYPVSSALPAGPADYTFEQV